MDQLYDIICIDTHQIVNIFPLSNEWAEYQLKSCKNYDAKYGRAYAYVKVKTHRPAHVK